MSQNLNKQAKELIEELTEFLEHPVNKRIFISSLKDIRPLYRGHASYKNLVAHIFNSSWNRHPNFDNPSVRASKLGYVMRLGTGLASINQIPISLLIDTISPINNFLLKDRGHILELTCCLYGEKMWKTCELEEIVLNEIKYLETAQNKTSDRIKALHILANVKNFISQTDSEMISSGIVDKTKRLISLQEICDSVSEFDFNLNKTDLSIEVKKESIPTHIREILQINNINNKWMDAQLAWLNFWAYCFDKDNNSEYIDSKLEYEKLISLFEQDSIFNGDYDKKSNYPLMSNSITDYCKKLSEGSIVVPMSLVSIDASTQTLSDVALKLEKETESALTAQYQNLYDLKITKKQFEKYKVEYRAIIEQPHWKNLKDKIDKLVKKYKSPNRDLENLKHTNLLHISYGGAALIACKRLIQSKGNKGRTSPAHIERIVKDFCNNLYKRIESVCEAGTYFPGVAKKSSARVTYTIGIVYDDMMKQGASAIKMNEQEVYEYLLDEVKQHLNGQTKFNVVKLTLPNYNGTIVETTQIDFDDLQRNTAGFDLGHKVQTTGDFTIDNCFIQQKHHNRAYHSVDHIIDSVGYWKWYSKVNLEIVSNNKQYFIDNDMIEVIADAKKLNERFN
jgi:hypothetical protein